MVNKNFYNTVLSQVYSPCGNYLIVGDIYGQISVFYLSKIINPEASLTKQDQLPKNVFTVLEDTQINSLLATNDHLIVGTVDEILAYDWKAVKNTKGAKISWKIELPNVKDNYEKVDINCLIRCKQSGLIYAGCGDNNIYAINIEVGTIVRKLSEHKNYIHSICNLGNDLVSGGEDGVVNIWDIRDKQVVNKIEPHKNDKIGRSDLGKWIGAVSMNEDWLLCGGGPRLSLWHFRSLIHSTIFPISDSGIHVAEFNNDRVIAGGRANFLYVMSYNGDTVAEIPVSSVTVYSAIHQTEPFKALCIGGSSPKIDICSNFHYRDQILSLY